MTEEVSLDGDGENVRSGLVGLVLAVVEILDEALENEAVRRMEAGQLTDEEIERVGTQLERLDEEITRLEREEGVEEEVADLRGDLDRIIDDALLQMRENERRD